MTTTNGPREGDEPIVEARPRHHGKWSRRCPHCLSTALASVAKGCLECVACKAVLLPPNPRAPAPSHATGACHPCWEDDHRLQDGTWDAYSRRGSLVDAWGSSTCREDGNAPPEDDTEEMPPRVRAEAVRGEADDVLDAEIRAYVGETEALGDAVKALRRFALTMLPPRKKPRRAPRDPEPVRRLPVSTPSQMTSLVNATTAVLVEEGFLDPGVVDEMKASVQVFDLARIEVFLDGELLADTTTALELAPVDEQAHLFKSLEELGAGDWVGMPPRAVVEVLHTVPRWHAALGDAVRTAMLSQLAVLAIVLTNALKRRGVPVDGTLDFVSPKTKRTTPFANYGHAIAAAFGVDEPGGGSPIPRNAIATHKLPQGLVFGQIACRPSRSYPASAKELSLDDKDVWTAIAAARVGARTYMVPEHEDPGTHERGIRRDVGRPLLVWEVEALRLLDAGEERPAAHRTKRTKRIDALAVERLTYEEALRKLKGHEGAPKTVHELKLGTKAARKAVRLVLEDLGLIPCAGGRVADVAELADHGAAPKAMVVNQAPKKRKQSSPFGDGGAGGMAA